MANGVMLSDANNNNYNVTVFRTCIYFAYISSTESKRSPFSWSLIFGIRKKADCAKSDE